MKYVIGKRNNPYGVTNDRAICEVLSEFKDSRIGVERLNVRILYRSGCLLFEEYNDKCRDFSVKKKYFREIKNADSYVKRYNSKVLKNVSNKDRILEIMDVNKKIPEAECPAFPF